MPIINPLRDSEMPLTPQSIYDAILGPPTYTGPDMWAVPGGGKFGEVRGFPKAYMMPSENFVAIQRAVLNIPPSYIFDISTLEYTNDKQKTKTTLKFNPTVMGNITEDGSPPLLETESSSTSIRLVHKGLGFVIPVDLYNYPPEEIQDLISCCNSLVEKCCLSTLMHSTLTTMFTSSDFYIMNFIAKDKLPYPKQVREAYNNWALFNKGDTEMARGVSLLKEQMRFQRADPDKLVVPRGTKHLIAFDEVSRTYSKRGNAAERLVSEGIDSFRTINDLHIVEVPDFNVLDQMDERDPSCKIAEIGSYVQLIDISGDDVSKYNTSACMSVEILDASIGNGNKTKITAKTCLDNCHLFEEGEGKLHPNHDRVIDSINTLKQKYHLNDKEHEDCLFISYEMDDTASPYKTMKHFGEMHQNDIDDEFINKFANTCMNALNEVGSDLKTKLCNFSKEILDLNEVNLSSPDVQAWIMAYYISTTEKYENHNKLSPLPPRVGADGLSILNKKGIWCYIVPSDGNLYTVVEGSAANATGNNNNAHPAKMIFTMKPIGYGSAAGLRILNAMYCNDDLRGYDKASLKKYSEIHGWLEYLYEKWKSMFPSHDLDNPINIPRMFKNFVRAEHRDYTAWLSNLCLPLQNGMFVRVKHGGEGKSFQYKNIKVASNSQPDGNLEELKLLCIDRSNYFVGDTVIFAGTGTDGRVAYPENRDVNPCIGGKSFQFVQHLPISPNGKIYAVISENKDDIEVFCGNTQRSIAAKRLATQLNGPYSNHGHMNNAQYYNITNSTKNLFKRVGIYHPNTVNRYNRWSFKEVNPIKRMFILSFFTQNINRKALVAFLDSDILFPLSFDIDRPRQRYLMGDVVMIQSRGAAMRTYYGHKYEGMSSDLTHAEYFIRCTMNVGCMILDDKKIHRLEHAICLGYMSGGSTDIIKTASDMEDLRHNPDDAEACMFIKAMPYRRELSKDAKDFNGIWGPSSYRLTRTNPAGKDLKPHRRNVMYYAKLWEDWANSGNGRHTTISAMNTILFPDWQMFYDPLRQINKIFTDQGPFETKNFDGFVRERESKISSQLKGVEYQL